MTEITAEALKDKLENAINTHMRKTGQGKTVAISAIAEPLNVQPRQIYKWLKAESFPHNATNLVLALDNIATDLEKYKSDIRAPGSISSEMKFPFRVVVERDTLKIARDDQGNVVIEGTLSMGLL